MPHCGKIAPSRRVAPESANTGSGLRRQCDVTGRRVLRPPYPGPNALRWLSKIRGPLLINQNIEDYSRALPKAISQPAGLAFAIMNL